MKHLHYAVFALCFLISSGVSADISQLQVTACEGGLGEPCGQTTPTVKRGHGVTFRILAHQLSAFENDKAYGQIEIDLIGSSELILEGCHAEEVAPLGPVTWEFSFSCQDGEFIRINPYNSFPPVYDPTLLAIGQNKEMAEFTIRVADTATPGLKQVTMGQAKFFRCCFVDPFVEPILFAPLVYVPEYECRDGIDNDLDGLTDLADPGCHGDPNALSELPDCLDGLDNDDDGLVDFADPGCNNGGQTSQSTTEDNEVVVPACGLFGIEGFLLIGMFIGAQRIMRQRF